MATHHGKDGIVRIGSNAVAEVREFSLSIEADTADDTAMGDTWKSHLVGMKSWSGSVTCMWDETNTTGQEAMTEGASVALKLYLEGVATGATFYEGTATVTSVNFSQSLDGIVTRSFNYLGNGAVTKSTAP